MPTCHAAMRRRCTIVSAAVAALLALAQAGPARAADKLLQEAVEFSGAVMYLKFKVPGLIIGAVRNGEVAISGFGRIGDASSGPPNGDTTMRIGSIAKAFAGQVLASMVVDGTVKLTDPLEARLGWGVKVPERDGQVVRLVHLATQTSGLPRDYDRPTAPPADPFSTLTKANMIKSLTPGSLLYTPGRGGSYSNFAFDLLAAALANAGKKPYEVLLRERVLTPAGLTATTFTPTAAQRKNMFQGHGFDGKPLQDGPTSVMMQGSGGLYSTPRDILRWMAWHLDTRAVAGAETRLLNHTGFFFRDGLKPVYGLDEAGQMDAMGLGWVILMPKGSRPLILQKSGVMHGVISYVAFSPTRGIAVFVAFNEFNFGAAFEIGPLVNDLIATLAPR